MDLVAEFRGGGQLWQGSHADASEAIHAYCSEPYKWLDPGGTKKVAPADALVLAAREFQPGTGDLPVFRAFLDDRPFVGKKHRDQQVSGALRASRWTLAQLLRGKRVLVTCAAGLNRSGLVVGLVLVGAGVPGERAVKAVRAARGSQALSNPSFEALLRSIPAGRPARV